MLIALAMIAMRVPRLTAAAALYAGGQTPQIHIFKRSDLSRIANAIGSKTAKVDIGYVQAPFLLLVE